MDLYSEFRKYIRQIIPLSDLELAQLQKILQFKHIQKREHLVEMNQICDKVVFFMNGYFRFYHFSNEGIEITSDFYFAPGFVTSYTSLITGNISKVNVQAMDEMQLLVLYKHDLEDLYQKSHAIEHLGRIIAEQVAITSEKHLFSLLFQSAEERYQNLLSQNPEFVKSIPLQYIASYLGISPETLSRVRRKIIG